MVVFETDVQATPATIWKACFADMKFEKWDPDITHLGDLKGGCANGTTFNFMMKSGPKAIPCELSDVKENESLRFTGRGLMGMMSFDGFIEITDKDVATSHIKYTFSMGGLVGGMISTFASKAVVEGTEKGLENMKTLSEELQGSGK